MKLVQYLICNNKYFPLGNDPKLMSRILHVMTMIGNIDRNLDPIRLQLHVFRSSVEEHYEERRVNADKLQFWLADLEEMIKTPKDMMVFFFTYREILFPLKYAIDHVPNNNFLHRTKTAESYLKDRGLSGLVSMIDYWCDWTESTCSIMKRSELVHPFKYLSHSLKSSNLFSDEDQILILAAFVQEFERRASQKRKTRGSSSNKNVISILLDFYKIKRSTAPKHFQAEIEVDGWVKTKDNWLIGISCKRRIREHWKQVSSAESAILSKFKIKNIFHIVTYDEDLSDDKLALLGAHRHIFYLPDSSRILKHASGHIGLSGYVRPISSIIKDLKSEIK